MEIIKAMRKGLGRYKAEADFEFDMLLKILCVDADVYQVRKGVYRVVGK